MQYKEQIDLSRIPQHVAIIMDGNGRWATKRGLPRKAGHKAGAEALERIIYAAKDRPALLSDLFVTLDLLTR